VTERISTRTHIIKKAFVLLTKCVSGTIKDEGEDVDDIFMLRVIEILAADEDKTQNGEQFVFYPCLVCQCLLRTKHGMKWSNFWDKFLNSRESSDSRSRGREKGEQMFEKCRQPRCFDRNG